MARVVCGREPVIAGVPFWADSALLADAGIPTVLFGPIGEGAHAEVEWVDVASLERCQAVYVGVAESICGVGPHVTERREGPDLSVILASHGPYDVVADVLASLRGQSVADRIELVLVTTDDSWLDAIPEHATTGLARRPPGDGRAAQSHPARSARRRFTRRAADVVVICEDHVDYDARWAEALIARHREPWAAVGPAFHSGNPDSLVELGGFRRLVRPLDRARRRGRA